MRKEDFCHSVETEFKKHYPESFITCGFYKGIGVAENLHVNFGLFSKEDWPNTIFENDPMSHKYLGHGGTDTFELVPLSFNLAVNPSKDSYYAMERVKTGARKKTGDLVALDKYFKNYFKKLKGIVKENKDNIYGDQKVINKYV